MADITALGEMLIDFTPNGKNKQGIDLYACNPGGAPANVLAMVVQLGGTASFIGKVGNDAFGDFLEESLKRNGIDTKGLVRDSAVPTTLAFVHLDSRGDRSFSFYRNLGADAMLMPGEICWELIDNCRVFHFGSVSLTAEPCRSAAISAVAYAREHGKLISFDANYRDALWPGEAQAVAQMRKAAAMTDILKVSEEEMRLISGETDISQGADKLLQMGPSLVLVSRGEKGAYYRNAQCAGMVPAYAVDTVDTTGAGDAFMGTVLYQLRAKTAENLKTISRQELERIVRYANAAGSLTTTAGGAIPAMPEGYEVKKCVETMPLLH